MSRQELIGGSRCQCTLAGWRLSLISLRKGWDGPDPREQPWLKISRPHRAVLFRHRGWWLTVVKQ